MSLMSTLPSSSDDALPAEVRVGTVGAFVSCACDGLLTAITLEGRDPCI